MHYYTKNIGDYSKKAGRLSILQHGVYNLLMDAVYDREQFPTMDEAIDWVWASSSEEIEALEFVLRKFFTLEHDGIFTQKRMEKTIQEYQGKCLTNAINGKKGGRPVKEKRETEKTQSVKEITQSVNLETQSVNSALNNNPNESLNHKPITNNHKPIEKIYKKETIPPEIEWVDKYIAEKGFSVNANEFIDYHDSRGWVVGKTKMKNWEAAVRTFQTNAKKWGNKNETSARNTKPKSKAEEFWSHTKARIQATA